jgi:hypothetical protein
MAVLVLQASEKHGNLAAAGHSHSLVALQCTEDLGGRYGEDGNMATTPGPYLHLRSRKTG